MSRKSSSVIGPSPRAEVRRRPREQGASLAALLAGLTVMLIGLGAAAPTWHYLVRNDREQELIFRGLEIVRALRIYQKFQGQSLPPNIEPLVKAKYLRQAYTDPMTQDGKWDILRQGMPAEGCAQAPEGAAGQVSPQAPPQQPPGQHGIPGMNQPAGAPGGLPAAEGTSGETLGASTGMIGVRSKSKDQSLRIMMGRNHYHEWCFTIYLIPPNVWAASQLVGLKQGETAPPFEAIPGQRDWSRMPTWPFQSGGRGGAAPAEEAPAE
jgi:hypothetical protein